MPELPAHEFWKKILGLLEEKLQYGFLKQAEAVVDVKITEGELVLRVATDEARDFFSSPVNQQRLMIVSRSVMTVESIRTEKITAERIR